MNPQLLLQNIKQFNRYVRKYTKLTTNGTGTTVQIEFLKKRIERLREFLCRHLLATKLSAAALGLILSAGTMNAQVYAPATINPFGLTNPIGSQYVNAIAQGDLDGDGDMDILSNTFSISGPTEGFFIYYQNTGTIGAPNFAAPVSNAFSLPTLPNSYYVPTLVDLDNDGDLDIMAGTYSSQTIYYFQNTGTPSAPAFAAPVTNPFGISTVSLDFWGMYNTDFADMDADGDLDMMVGDYGATLHYFQNTGTVSSPAFAAPVANPFGCVQGFRWGIPELTDYDGDGDIDMMVGDRNDGFYYYQNTGTTSAPAFAPRIHNPGHLGFLGSIGNFLEIYDYDNDGDKDMLVGSSILDIYYLENVCPDFAPLPTSTTPAGNLSICAGNSTVLSASGTGTLSWYDADTLGVYLGSGSNFTTDLLNGTTDFYVQDSTCAESPDRVLVTVTVNPLPDVSTTNVSVSITVGETGATSYQWVTCPAYTIAPDTSTNQTYNASANGDYAVIVDLNGCVDTSACVSITTTGIAQNNQSSLQVFPNPSNGSFVIRSAEKGSYVIVDELGQTVYSFVLSAANNFSVPVEHLASGIYFVNSITATHATRLKIVITK